MNVRIAVCKQPAVEAPAYEEDLKLARHVEGDVDPATFTSNTFEIEWPPRSGRKATFPEIDRAQWFDRDAAARKILPSQLPILEELAQRLQDG